MALGTLTVSGVEQSGAEVTVKIPSELTKVQVLSYCKGPDEITGGTDGTTMSNFKVKTNDGSRWYDYGKITVEHCAVAAGEEARFNSVTLAGGMTFKFTVADDRNEDVDVDIELVVA